jgi:large subunit ribosomal protein L28
MARRCDITGTGAQTGNKVSHSNHKTKTKFLPNLRNVTFTSEALGHGVSLRVTAATIRTVDINGGLDEYLLSTSSTKLTEEAQKLKRKIKKAAAAKAVAA